MSEYIEREKVINLIDDLSAKNATYAHIPYILAAIKEKIITKIPTINVNVIDITNELKAFAKKDVEKNYIDCDGCDKCAAYCENCNRKNNKHF